ncbi:coenzyme A disulfide reductase [Levilactobacillus koreensis JCM 16448]|uniref:CoA-disulfide reductase n=1 Tax=Levilactobacillus koreensis TaxID=637971 RepID=A0AAC8UVS4_9LACO|nr:FAD-dependent oxidoreductase [Levilactobacillus koreensis]AKP64793.1 CoA-disulfide reductase [Levilactobacillus koreensis]KRK87679.1 coenzyme A disulfide reductase [Levilactobacillus koreensis JCM 16448]
MKIIIIGGVAGGMSAATRLRRLDEQAEITVYEKGPYVSFANCGLPFHLSGEIADRDDLIVQSATKLRQRFNLNVQPNHEVLAIHPAEKTVAVRHAGKVQIDHYDRLILAPGSRPIAPDLPGLAAAKSVFTLHTIPDLDRIMATVNEATTKRVLLVGGGFIGLEVAESLRQRGLAVTIVERAGHLLPPLDDEMAAMVQNELIRNGVHILTNQAVKSFTNDGHVAVLDDGTRLAADLTILAVGVRPASELAKAAGLKLGWHEGIVVDNHYQTSDPNIYAVGDAILVKQQLTGHATLIPLASPANRQGRQVADNVMGIAHPNRGSLGTAIVRAFGLTAAMTGLSEQQVRQDQLAYQVVHVRGQNHASYFPNGTPMTLKLIFDPQNGKIYGAQGVGAQGVDKRIDVLATAIKGGLTIDDLPELELTYAPPFGSAKDPVNMLGYAAENLAAGLSKSIQWHELPATLAAGKQLLDVRNPDELRDDGHFPDSLNLPLDQLRERLNELDPQQPYVVSCFSGQRSYIAERILRQRGFDVVNLDGAFALYREVRPQDLIKD